MKGDASNFHNGDPDRTREAYLQQLNDLALRDLRLMPHVGSFTKLATRTLGMLIALPPMRDRLEEIVENASQPCVIPDCQSLRVNLRETCARHSDGESEHGHLHLRCPTVFQLQPLHREARVFLKANASHPQVLSTEHHLQRWINDPDPKPPKHKKAIKVYMQARADIRAARLPAAEVLAVLTAMQLWEKEVHSGERVLVDPMTQNWTRFGATCAGRVVLKLLSRRISIKATGHACRCLAASLHADVLPVSEALAAAVMADRKRLGRDIRQSMAPFVSPVDSTVLRPDEVPSDAP